MVAREDIYLPPYRKMDLYRAAETPPAVAHLRARNTDVHTRDHWREMTEDSLANRLAKFHSGGQGSRLTPASIFERPLL